MSRRVYVWDMEAKALVEVGGDWTPTPRTQLMTGTCFEGSRATDGTDIGSRRKRAEYMKAHNLADASDYSGTWDKAAKERAAFYTDGASHKQRREDVARTLYRLKKP